MYTNSSSTQTDTGIDIADGETAKIAITLPSSSVGNTSGTGTLTYTAEDGTVSTFTGLVANAQNTTSQTSKLAGI